MEKLIKIVNSPFNPNMEVVDKIVVKLHVPYSEKEVTVQVNPNIQDYLENNDQVDIKVRQVTVSTNTDQTQTLSFDFQEKNVHKFEIENEKYEMRLMSIGKEKIQGQDFPLFEFLVKHL